MSAQRKARPYKTISGNVYLLSNHAILKPSKVDAVLIVPNAIMDSLCSESYKYLYNDDFIDLFRKQKDFAEIKSLIIKLKGGHLEDESRVEIDKSINYTLGRYPNKIGEYIRKHFPAEYEVTFTNGSQILIKNLVYQNILGSKGFELFLNTESQEFFRFPKVSVERIEII